MNYHYNKGSIWKRILIYILIGAVAYGLIYYFFLKTDTRYNNQDTGYNNQTNSNDQNSNSEIAGWKTYRNDEYGFELQYPSDYESQGPGSGPLDGRGDSVQVGFIFEDKSEQLDLSNTFKININPTPLNFTLDKIVSGPVATVVDGVPGQRYKIKWEWDDKEYVLDFVEVKKDTSYYIFSNSGLKLNSIPFDQILSTFKFTK